MKHNLFTVLALVAIGIVAGYGGNAHGEYAPPVNTMPVPTSNSPMPTSIPPAPRPGDPDYAPPQLVANSVSCDSDRVQLEVAEWDKLMKRAVAKTITEYNGQNYRLGLGFVGNLSGAGKKCDEVVRDVEANLAKIVKNQDYKFYCTNAAIAYNEVAWGLASHAFIAVVDSSTNTVLRQYDPWRTGNADFLPANYQDIDTIDLISIRGWTISPPPGMDHITDPPIQMPNYPAVPENDAPPYSY